MRKILAVVAAVGIAFGTASVAHADPTVGFGYTSDEGAYPFEGSASWTADEVTAWEYGGAVKVDAESPDGWDWARLELSAPAGQQLHEGTYSNAAVRQQNSPQLATPGFIAFRGTRAGGTGACAAPGATADFTVSRLTRAADGAVTDLDVTFVLRCSAAVTRGEAHFHR
ncbi:hypothetical protein [Amycolatopsis echigonensis]|uniref:Secreted protein n=1 Tax=Amycolatopsis echigonensis TaxID=2576905 RepID=A0A8E1VZJ3_9PSEU|nr:hypothetical protein [Amycolatopsis echigonensis]MBB2501353.1 hypothetical protein [Amycolatopsis echigonensis]